MQENEAHRGMVALERTQVSVLQNSMVVLEVVFADTVERTDMYRSITGSSKLRWCPALTLHRIGCVDSSFNIYHCLSLSAGHSQSSL